MNINATAIRSKPQVGLHSAVGLLKLKADGLVDACMLTAIFRCLSGDGHSGLRKALQQAVKSEAKRMQDHKPCFQMLAPRRSPKGKS